VDENADMSLGPAMTTNKKKRRLEDKKRRKRSAERQREHARLAAVTLPPSFIQQELESGG
jgi:hypothetical protein